MFKYAVNFIIFTVVLFGVNSCTKTVRQETVTENRDNYETRVYEVFGMDCPGCHGGLEKLVMKLSAVYDAKANWEKKQLVVLVQPGATLNDDEVYNAIRRANFTVGKRLE